MPFAWRPTPGQVALIEVDGQDACLTGVVLDEPSDGEQPVVIDLGASPRPTEDECEVVVSFFAPDALYRVKATATRHEGTGDAVIDLRMHDVQRVQRRQVPRTRLVLPAVLSNFDDPGAMVNLVGETLDLGEGGCRVRTARSFPSGCDPTVTVNLPRGETFVALGAILHATANEGGFEYRIVFLEIEDEDRARLAQAVRESQPAIA